MSFKHIILSLICICVSLGGFAQVVRPTPTPENSRYVVLYNRTKQPFLEVYMTTSPQQGWGPDLLGRNILMPEDTIIIDLPFYEPGSALYFKTIDKDYRVYLADNVFPDISPKVVILPEDSTGIPAEERNNNLSENPAGEPDTNTTTPPVEDLSPYDPDILDPVDYYSGDKTAPENAYAILLRNTTGEIITQVYAASIDEQSWGDNLIQDKTLKINGAYRIYVPKKGQNYCDFKFIGQTGVLYFKWGINLEEISELEIIPGDHPL